MSEGVQQGWKCPECGDIQLDKDNCMSCDFGDDEEGWEEVNVVDDPQLGLIEVG
jgi:hypothetical protein